MKNEINLIAPLTTTISELNHYIDEYRLHKHKRELYYHFNLGEWNVNLANTKKTMINYDFRDLVGSFYVKLPKNDGETNRDHHEREIAQTEMLRSNLLKLYNDFRKYVMKQLESIAKTMKYDDLFDLFDYTWGEAPFKLNYLLEDMFLLLGDKSIMQNVVGNSGSFKSTRTMIEANSLPAVLFIDDATVAGISRDCQTKGNDYLNNTVVYYNDVGDSSQMINNFKDCLQTVYKKLFSEGRVNRTIAQKNSDRTLHLDLVTEDGFKLKFNSVKPVFNEDDGQTSARTMIIVLPSFTIQDAEELILSGRFGNDVWTRQDPRIFKDILQAYYQTRPKPKLSNEHRNVIQLRVTQDNNGEVNWHKIQNAFYIHEEMIKLYGMEHYKDKYFNRVMINTSVKDLESELYDTIKEGLNIEPFKRSELSTEEPLNRFVVAKTKSASAHKDSNDFNSFTIKAVKGIRRKFINKNESKISMLLKSMEEHDLCEKVGMLKQRYNIYVLLERDDKNDEQK